MSGGIRESWRMRRRSSRTLSSRSVNGQESMWQASVSISSVSSVRRSSFDKLEHGRQQPRLRGADVRKGEVLVELATDNGVELVDARLDA